MKKFLFVTTLALILSGCGGGSDTPAAPQAPAIDAFTAKALEIAAATPDTGEPTSVDSLTATAPEDTQPVPII